jgi:hypothetical protein
MSTSLASRPWPREVGGDGGHLRDIAGGRGAGGTTRLDSLRAAGLVRRASDRVDEGVERSLPVTAALRALLPGGCLRRGGTVAIRAATSTGPGDGSAGVTGSGATSLLFALLAQASTAGSWCAAVGMPRLGLVAAAEAGVAVDRLALVPHPGPDWVDTVGALLDGVDIVALATPGGVAPQLAARIVARARQRGAVLVAVGAWPGVDTTLDVVRARWHGLGQGVGRLRRREVEVVASGRGAAVRPRRARLWLPGSSGAAAPAAPALTSVSVDDYRVEEQRWAS